MITSPFQGLVLGEVTFTAQRGVAACTVLSMTSRLRRSVCRPICVEICRKVQDYLVDILTIMVLI